MPQFDYHQFEWEGGLYDGLSRMDQSVKKQVAKRVAGHVQDIVKSVSRLLWEMNSQRTLSMWRIVNFPMPPLPTGDGR